MEFFRIVVTLTHSETPWNDLYATIFEFDNLVVYPENTIFQHEASEYHERSLKGQ